MKGFCGLHWIGSRSTRILATELLVLSNTNIVDTDKSRIFNFCPILAQQLVEVLK